MKQEILSAATGQHSRMTNPQGSLLFKLTGLMFWKPESLPEPNIDQASILIGGMISFNKKETTFEHNKVQLSNDDILECIQLWFPSIESMKQVKPHFFKKKTANGHEPESEPKPDTPPPAPHKKTSSGGSSHSPQPLKPDIEPEPEPEPAKPPKPEENPVHPVPPVPSEKPADQPKPEPEPEPPVQGFEELENLILKAGLRNLWLVGPAGCGKTTICKAVAERLELPATVIPCGAGTSATTFLGYKYPEREGTPFVGAFAKPGIIVLDEFTALESQVAQVANAALANNELSSTVGTFQRHPDCTIIATSNTFGHGANRVYVSNNQLDASTIDRFACGIIETDYSHQYEVQYDKEVVLYVNRLRNTIDKNGLRQVASTRAIINACKRKQAGLSWKESITTGWSKDEKALL